MSSSLTVRRRHQPSPSATLIAVLQHCPHRRQSARHHRGHWSWCRVCPTQPQTRKHANDDLCATITKLRSQGRQPQQHRPKIDVRTCVEGLGVMGSTCLHPQETPCQGDPFSQRESCRQRSWSLDSDHRDGFLHVSKACTPGNGPHGPGCHTPQPHGTPACSP